MKVWIYRAIALVAWVAIVYTLARGQNYDGSTFDRDRAAPPSALKVFREKCQPCHSGEKPPNGLRLDSVDNMVRGGKSGPALVPRDPDASLLFKYITAGKMPPAKPLSRADQATIRKWIEAGAMQYSMGPYEP